MVQGIDKKNCTTKSQRKRVNATSETKKIINKAKSKVTTDEK